MPSFLAQVAPPPPSGIWYPTILGILVVAVAIMLFCGSIYVLLATNLGARLGFLCAFTALTGFMVLLTTLWMFTASPLNTLKGTPPVWKLVTVTKKLDQSSIPPAVRSAPVKGRKVPTASQSDLKAVVDAALVTKQPIANIPSPANANQYAKFQAVTDYTTTNYYEVGGSNPHLLDWQISHQPLYAVVQFCAVPPNTLPFGVPPPPPTCDKTSPANGFAILKRDFGSLRIPPFVTFVISVILFGLGLLSLHWREKDERALAAAEAEATKLVPTPAST
ncbi:MAG TPA: hypothetical protein VLV81_09170 [Acidimicrobiia bacterium]|nr:hypothetical protein [Acidimicrobiia bacterium]